MREKAFALFLMTLLGLVCGANGNETVEMTADFSAPCGTVKPLHGVNNSPCSVPSGDYLQSYPV